MVCQHQQYAKLSGAKALKMENAFYKWFLKQKGKPCSSQCSGQMIKERAKLFNQKLNGLKTLELNIDQIYNGLRIISDTVIQFQV